MCDVFSQLRLSRGVLALLNNYDLEVRISSGAAARRRVRRSPRRALALGGPARRARAVLIR